MHTIHQKLTAPIRACIANLSENALIRLRTIFNSLCIEFPDASITLQDIRNYRKVLRREVLNGYTPTQALIRYFEAEEIEHQMRYKEVGESCRILGLFFTYPWCQAMWKRFP